MADQEQQPPATTAPDTVMPDAAIAVTSAAEVVAPIAINPAQPAPVPVLDASVGAFPQDVNAPGLPMVMPDITSAFPNGNILPAELVVPVAPVAISAGKLIAGVRSLFSKVTTTNPFV